MFRFKGSVINDKENNKSKGIVGSQTGLKKTENKKPGFWKLFCGCADRKEAKMFDCLLRNDVKLKKYKASNASESSVGLEPGRVREIKIDPNQNFNDDFCFPPKLQELSKKMSEISKNDDILAETKESDNDCDSINEVQVRTRKYFFTSEVKGYIKVWNTRSNKLLKDLGKIHNDHIRSIACTTDEKYLITSDVSGIIQVWSIPKNFKLIKKTVNVHQGELYCINITPDNKYLYTSSFDGELKQFGIAQRDGMIQLVKNFGRVHDCEIRSILINPLNTCLFTGDSKSNMKKWLTHSEETIYESDCQNALDKITTMCITKNGKYIFVGTNGGTLTRYLTEKFENDIKLAEHRKVDSTKITALQSCSKSEVLLVGNTKGEISLQNIIENNFNFVKKISQAHNCCITYQTFCNHQTLSLLLSTDLKGNAKKWIVSESDIKPYINLGQIHKSTIKAIA